jgi:hypothetical protein
MANKSSDTVYFTFGRFNPPTIGHAAMIETLIEKARPAKADIIVFPSATQDKKKNPLYAFNKTHYIEVMFPRKTGVQVLDPTVTGLRTIFDVVAFLKKEGYTKLHFVVGSDRVEEFSETLKKYHPDVLVESGGERDMNSNGTNVAGMKATTVRKAAANKNWTTFRKGVHAAIEGKNYEELYAKIRGGLGLNAEEAAGTKSKAKAKKGGARRSRRTRKTRRNE